MDGSPQRSQSSSRKNLWSALSLGFVIVFLAACFYYVWSHWDEFFFVTTVSLRDVSVAAAFVLVSYILNSYQLGLFFVKFGLHIGQLERLALTMGMLLGNLVIPMRGGSGGLALYLKSVHSLDFEAFALIYGGAALLMGLINAAMAVGALIYLAVAHGFYQPALTGLSAALLVGTGYLVFRPPPSPWQYKGLLGVFFRISQAWRLITQDKPLMRSLIFSTVAIVVCLFWAFWFIYQATQSSISFFGVVVASSIGNIANLIPFTPGSLGIFDTATIQVPLLFDLDLPKSMAATFLFRTLCFGWAFLFGLPGAFYLMRKRRLGSRRAGCKTR